MRTQLWVAVLIAAAPGLAAEQSTTGPADPSAAAAGSADPSATVPAPAAEQTFPESSAPGPASEAMAVTAAVPDPAELRAAIQASRVLKPAAGPFLGQHLRYPHANILQRVAADLAAIPLNVTRWDARDWTWFGITAGATVGLFLPLDAPLDQRFQNWLGEVAFVPGVWSKENDIYIFGGLFAAAVGTLGYGYFTGQDAYVETFSLLAEALAVTQAFHISSKLLLSRDGPNTGNGRTIYGPTAGTFERFPEGAPSGHTATLFALATVIHLYWDNLLLSTALYAAASAFATAIVLDRYHYVSDVLWGGSMGVAVGRYVVRHRSSRYAYAGGEPVKRSALAVTPMILPTPDGAVGGAVVQGDF